MRLATLGAALDIAQFQWPERRGHTFADLSARDFGQFHRRPTDITDQPVRAGPAKKHALGREPRLFLAVDDMDFQPGLAQHLFAKPRPVFGIPHGRRGHGRQRWQVHAARQILEALKCGQRTLAAFGVQHAGARHTGPKAAHDLFIVEISRAARRAIKNHQPDRVRPDIDHAHARQFSRTRIVEQWPAERSVIVGSGVACAVHRHPRGRLEPLMARAGRWGQSGGTGKSATTGLFRITLHKAVQKPRPNQKRQAFIRGGARIRGLLALLIRLARCMHTADRDTTNQQ